MYRNILFQIFLNFIFTFGKFTFSVLVFFFSYIAINSTRNISLKQREKNAKFKVLFPLK